jgi:hypothetical protein
MRKLPGVIAIYHYSRPEKNDETTLVIWKDKDSLIAYRQGELIKEAIAFENKLGLKTTREAYPLIIGL